MESCDLETGAISITPNRRNKLLKSDSLQMFSVSGALINNGKSIFSKVLSVPHEDCSYSPNQAHANQ